MCTPDALPWELALHPTSPFLAACCAAPPLPNAPGAASFTPKPSTPSYSPTAPLHPPHVPPNPPRLNFTSGGVPFACSGCTYDPAGVATEVLSTRYTTEPPSTIQSNEVSGAGSTRDSWRYQI